jgi:hypothetical protein
MPDVREAKRTYDEMRGTLMRVADDDTTEPERVLNIARLYREAWNDLLEAANAAGWDTTSTSDGSARRSTARPSPPPFQRNPPS